MTHPQLRLDNQLCFRFYTISRLITQAYTPQLAKQGLTYPQFITLMVLWEKDEQPVNDIAKRLYLNTNTVTPLLQRMETDGLLTRTRGSKDGRQVIVRLTDKGRALEDACADIPVDLGNRLLCHHVDRKTLLELAPVLDALIAQTAAVNEQREKK